MLASTWTLGWDAVGAIATGVLALATTLLALTTRTVAQETQEVAKATQAEIARQWRPVLLVRTTDEGGLKRVTDYVFSPEFQPRRRASESRLDTNWTRAISPTWVTSLVWLYG